MVAVTGIGSGLDIDSLVRGLVDADRVPAERRLLNREASVTNFISGIGALKGALADLQSSFSSLKTSDVFSQKSASSSNSASVSVVASNDAAITAFDVEVTSLADNQTLTSTSFAGEDTVVGEGTLSIAIGTPTYLGDPTLDPDTSYSGFIPDAEISPISIIIDSSNNTLSGIRDAINTSGAGVSAVIINDDGGARLSITTDETGAGSSVAISVSETSGSLSALAYDATASNLTQGRAASDAQFKVNGVPLVSGSNTVEGVVDGIDITLKEMTDSPVSISVSENRGAVTSAIEQFVEGFNLYSEVTSQLTDFDQAANTRGQLQGDFSARSVVRRVQSELNTPSGINSDFNTLASIGITTDSDGKLSLDSATLNAALDSDPSAVAALFADTTYNGVQSSGLANRLDTTISDLLSNDGALSAREDGLDSRIDRINEERERLATRLERLEARYFAQFNAMDALLADITSTGDFLAQQLDNLPGYFDGNK